MHLGIERDRRRAGVVVRTRAHRDCRRAVDRRVRRGCRPPRRSDASQTTSPARGLTTRNPPMLAFIPSGAMLLPSSPRLPHRRTGRRHRRSAGTPARCRSPTIGHRDFVADLRRRGARLTGACISVPRLSCARSSAKYRGARCRATSTGVPRRSAFVDAGEIEELRAVGRRYVNRVIDADICDRPRRCRPTDMLTAPDASMPPAATFSRPRPT